MAANTFSTRTLTIANGGTTSDIVELEDWPVFGLVVPALTNSTLKLQVAAATGTFVDVFDSVGTALLTWAASTGSRAFASRDLSDIIGYKYLQIVCGTAQGAERLFTLIYKAPKTQ